jgi:hypothetical protein
MLVIYMPCTDLFWFFAMQGLNPRLCTIYLFLKFLTIERKQTSKQATENTKDRIFAFSPRILKLCPTGVREVIMGYEIF